MDDVVEVQIDEIEMETPDAYLVRVDTREVWLEKTCLVGLALHNGPQSILLFRRAAERSKLTTTTTKRG